MSRPRVSATGWLTAPAIPLGVGVALNGKLTIASLELGLTGSNGFDLSMGVECGPAPLGCQALTKLDPINKFTPKVTVPSSDQMKVELTATAYFITGLDLLLLKGLYKVGLAEATLGPVQHATLAFVDAQANDKGDASKYDLKLEGKLVPGSSINSAIKALLDEDPGKLGAELTVSRPLSTSPLGSMVVDRTITAPNTQKVHFDIKLDPKSTDYFLVGYNVSSIELYRRKEHETTYESMTSLAVSASAQTAFVWDWSPGREDIGKNEFFAFVKTVIPVLVPLEIASDSSRMVEVQDICIPPPAAGTPPGPVSLSQASSDCTLSGTLTHTNVEDSRPDSLPHHRGRRDGQSRQG